MIRSKCRTVIGFKAESGLSREDLVKRAKARMESYGLSAVVANDLDAVGMKTSSAVLITPDSVTDITGTKPEVSDAILDLCLRLL
jgi:phosphopantothenoylcysteine decarboxylase/phosphopantothenate--cysteine ligase